MLINFRFSKAYCISHHFCPFGVENDYQPFGKKLFDITLEIVIWRVFYATA